MMNQKRDVNVMEIINKSTQTLLPTHLYLVGGCPCHSIAPLPNKFISLLIILPKLPGKRSVNKQTLNIIVPPRKRRGRPGKPPICLQPSVVPLQVSL